MKSFQRYLIVIVSIGLMLISSCKKELDTNPIPDSDSDSDSETSIEDLTVNASFDWDTFSDMEISIKTLDNLDYPIPYVRVSLRTDYEANDGRNIFSGFTNTDGLFEINYSIAAAIDSLVVATNFLGFPSEVKIPIENNSLNFTFGGIPAPVNNQKSASALKASTETRIPLTFLGSWESDGTPNYLESERDYVSSSLLSDINIALPEYQPVPNYHPEYLSQSYDQNIYLSEKADVWVTFVAEGAGYLNSLAFYTFDKNNPPQSIDDINSATIIFPNVSFSGSGGGLVSGDKVHIGQFEAGTSIGWLIIANGYSSSSQTVTDGLNYFFTHEALNPETDPLYQQHTVLLKDSERDIFLISFEDLKRPYGDNDFNDAIFYVTANPPTAVDDSSIIERGAVDEDSDGDGISDAFDDYPDDGTSAANNYFPSMGTYATLAFEDLWPSMGDFDFNDLVLNYNFNTVTNDDNEVTKLKGEFIVRAIGAGFHNGFGFELTGILGSQIASVNGNILEENYIHSNTNGTESNQTYATIIVFDDAWNHGFGNTEPTNSYTEPTEIIQLEIVFTNPISIAQLGNAPFNAFLIVNKERGKEIHLPNYQPTSLANADYFGQNADDTNVQGGKYYKTENNLPWAINIPVQFDYPIEKESIDKAHLQFIPWVISEGTSYTNWYLNLTGYRDTNFIY